MAVTLTLVAAVTLGAATHRLSAQGREVASGGSGTSTSRVTSPTVVASWLSHESHPDGSTTTLLVLWRGTPGWFMKGVHGSASGGGSSARSSPGGERASYGYEYVTQGGLTFLMEFDYQKKVVKILNQEISLTGTNVVLVDFVDSPNGPAIVGTRWVDPAPPDQRSGVDPIAAIVKRTPELFDYLQCDLRVSDPLTQTMLSSVCGRMRP